MTFRLLIKSTAKKPDREFSSTQVNLDTPSAQKIIDFGKTIPEEDLAADGREDTPHITVKFGLHTNDPDEVRSKAEGFGPIQATIGELSLFKCPEYDVLKADVNSPDLHELNRRLCNLPHTDTHPEYVPHLTIAYLKPGMGEKYLGKCPLTGQELVFHDLVFSGKDRSKTVIPLGEVKKSLEIMIRKSDQKQSLRLLIKSHGTKKDCKCKDGEDCHCHDKKDSEPCDCSEGEMNEAHAFGVNGIRHPVKICPCGIIRFQDKETHRRKLSGEDVFGGTLRKGAIDLDDPGLNGDELVLLKAIPSNCYQNPEACGLRWITINSSGVEGQGQPVLVHDSGDHYTVVGGAGGKLNQLVLQRGKGKQWGSEKERKEKREERKTRAKEKLASQGVDVENLEAIQDRIKGEIKQQTSSLHDEVLGALLGRNAGAEPDKLEQITQKTMDAARDEALHRGASSQEAEEVAQVAAKRVKGEAKRAVREVVEKALDRTALAALGDAEDTGDPEAVEAEIANQKVVRHFTADELKSFVEKSSTIAELRSRSRAISRALESGGEKAVDGLRAVMEPINTEEAVKRGLDKYIKGKDVDIHTALVQESLTATPQAQERHGSAGAADAINHYVSSLTGSAILTPDQVRVMGTENAARIAASYLKSKGVNIEQQGAEIQDRVARDSTAHAAAALDQVREIDGMVQDTVDQARQGDGTVTEAEANVLRMRMAQEKYKILNVARGQLRAAAALGYAMKEGSDAPVEITGIASQKAAKDRAETLGLDTGDYKISKPEGQSRYNLEIKASALGKLAQEHGIDQSERNTDMDQLRYDVQSNPGQWRPEGVNDNILLRPHQELAARAIVSQKRILVAHAIGSGKTLVQFAALADLIDHDKIDRAIVTMPTKPRSQQLPYTNEETGDHETGELAKFLDPKMRDQFAIVEDGRQLKRAIGQVMAGNKKVIVMSPQLMRERVDELKAAGFGGERSAFFADEAHEIAIGQREGSGSQMARASRELAGSEYTCLLSGSPIENDSCIDGETDIYDPIRGITLTVKEWKEKNLKPNVWALNHNGHPVIVQASVPFVKSFGKMFDVTLSSGRKIRVAGRHRFLTEQGWKPLSELFVGHKIASCLPKSLPDTLEFSSSLSPSSLPLNTTISSVLLSSSDLLQERRISSQLPYVLREKRETSFAHRTFSSLLRTILRIRGSWLIFSQWILSLLRLFSSALVFLHDVPRTLVSPLTRNSCVRSLMQRVEGSLVDCQWLYRSYDGPLPLWSGNDQGSTPLSVDVLQRSLSCRSGDDQERIRPSNILFSSVLLSTSCCSALDTVQFEDLSWWCNLYRFFLGISSQFRDELQSRQPCFEECVQRSTNLSIDHRNCLCLPYRYYSVLWDDIQQIEEAGDAIIYDLEVPLYHNYLAHGVWHHNSEMWSLLNLLHPGEFGSQRAFAGEWGRLARSGGGIFSGEGIQRLRDRLSGTMVTYSKDPTRQGEHGEEPVQLTRKVQEVSPTEETRKEIAKIQRQYQKDRKSDDPKKRNAASMVRRGRIRRALSRDKNKIKAAKAIMDAEKERDPNARVGIYADELGPLKSFGNAMNGNFVSLTGEQDDGATREAIARINNRENDIDGALLSNAANYGVNLQGLDHIIKAHAIDVPSKEDQLDHRHFRSGQTRDVRTTSLISDHPVERLAQYRNRRVKLPEMALLALLADETPISSVLAGSVGRLQEVANQDQGETKKAIRLMVTQELDKTKSYRSSSQRVLIRQRRVAS